jgi:hypothetical protein
LSHTPDSVHCLCRRQHVEPDGKQEGISDHRAPVRKIHNTPSKQPRAGIGGRPPCGLGGGSGKNSEIKFHCSSVSWKSGSVLDPASASDEASRALCCISGLPFYRFYESWHTTGSASKITFEMPSRLIGLST